MFCDQCEQTAKGVGCTVAGVCGKNAEVALLQDQLIHLLRRLAPLVEQARSQGMKTEIYDDFIADALFATLTNVNFDPDAIKSLQTQALVHARTLAAELGARSAKRPKTWRSPSRNTGRGFPRPWWAWGRSAATRMWIPPCRCSSSG